MVRRAALATSLQKGSSPPTKGIDMKTILSYLALSTSLTACLAQNTGASDEDIVGGTADTIHPSVVQLRYQPDWQHIAQCTATVISPTVLLTAAHCTPAGAWGFQYNPSDSADWT